MLFIVNHAVRCSPASETIAKGFLTKKGYNCDDLILIEVGDLSSEMIYDHFLLHFAQLSVCTLHGVKNKVSFSSRSSC